MIKANNIEWEQKGNKIIISLFDIPFGLVQEKANNLFSDLCSKNVMFTLSLSYNKQQLIIYRKHDLKSDFTSKERSLFDYLITNYSLLPSVDFSELQLNAFKIENSDAIISILDEDDNESYLFAYQLTKIKANEPSILTKFTQIIQDLLNSKIVKIVVSYLPSITKSNIQPMWGLLITSTSTSKKQVISNHKKFKHYLRNLPVKINSFLTPLSKKDIVRHNANFRLLVPWVKQKDFFFDYINITKILGRQKNEPNLEKTESSKSRFIDQKQTPSIVQPCRKLPLKPYPSIKDVNPIQQTNIQKPTAPSIPSNINDMVVPSPRTINPVFDTEYLKVRLNGVFKELDFKETIIFEDIFDLVLRKGSSYIFVKFYKDIFNQEQAYKIVENLSSIAGLRNQFLCLVVADVIEEGSTKILNEFNILHLTLSDVLLDDNLKSKLYNTVVA